MTSIVLPPQTNYGSASDFLSSAKKLLIGGEWVDAASGQTFATINPATEQKLADVALGDVQDIDRAVAAARASEAASFG